VSDQLPLIGPLCKLVQNGGGRNGVVHLIAFGAGGLYPNELCGLIHRDRAAVSPYPRLQRTPNPPFAIRPMPRAYSFDGQATMRTTCAALRVGEDRSPGLGFPGWAAGLPGIRLSAGMEVPYADAGGVEVSQTTARQFGEDLARAICTYLMEDRWV